ncbi:nuclear transport factor 2 family protein [Nocardia salmonicida]|uniref:nuclear transport factor 2 family protein n=1 Tax=Nocardia salmonicida TaxID=53431 RepID=UPI00379AB14F
MSKDISVAEVQELMGSWWYHYDEAHYAELAQMLAPDTHYSVRSDTGKTEYEEFITAETHGREATMEWMEQHRLGSPYPLRHNGSNLHLTGSEAGVTSFRSYLLTTQITNGLPFAVASAIVSGSVARGPQGLWFTAQEVVLDTQNSVAALSELNTAAAE